MSSLSDDTQQGIHLKYQCILYTCVVRTPTSPEIISKIFLTSRIKVPSKEKKKKVMESQKHAGWTCWASSVVKRGQFQKQKFQRMWGKEWGRWFSHWHLWETRLRKPTRPATCHLLHPAHRLVCAHHLVFRRHSVIKSGVVGFLSSCNIKTV